MSFVFFKYSRGILAHSARPLRRIQVTLGSIQLEHRQVMDDLEIILLSADRVL